MAAQKGLGCVIKIGDGAGSEVFAEIGGARTKSITINNQPVDATSAASTGQFREYITAAGILSCSISASGVFQDDAPIGSVRTDALARTLRNFQIVIPGSTSNGTFEGPFIITSLQEGGDHDGEQTFDITLESGGQVTFT